MPFDSEKQRRFLWAKKPGVARQVAHDSAKMSGDGLAYRRYLEQGYSPEEADRLAGEGPVPVVPVAKMGRADLAALERQRMVAKFAARMGASLGLDPAPSLAKTLGISLEQAQAALEWEREYGSGAASDKADRVANHLAERPGYYAELDEALAVPMTKAITPSELRKGLVTKVQDAVAGRRAEKTRKRVLAEKKKDDGESQDSSGWEKGPKGGTRKRVGGKWVYKRSGDEEGAGSSDAGDESDEESAAPKVKGKTQSQLPGADAVAEQGQKAVDALKKKDPEKAADVQRALNHVVAGLRQRQKGRGTPESDKSLVDALKEFGRSFNQSAAPQSVLGPDLAGLLEANEKAEARMKAQTQADEKAQALDDETKHATSKVVAAAQKLAENAKGEVPKEKVEKAEGSRWGIGISLGGRDRLADIPDYQGIYHQPKDSAQVKREVEAGQTRRRASKKQLDGTVGFHGSPVPQPEPVLRYVVPKDPKGPRMRASDTKDRREAGAPYKPKTPGEIIRNRTDAGRVSSSPDPRDDERAPRGRRKKPKLVAKMHRERDAYDAQADAIVAKMSDAQLGRWSRTSASAFLSAGFRNAAAFGLTKSDVTLELLFKGQARGGKYIKRVPYTDSKGRRRYRYYYAESAVARDVKAGEDIRLGKRLVKVEHVDEDGTVHLLEPDGKKLRVAPEEWGTLLSRHYGARYFEWAERRASQSVNAVLRHVPKKMLEDLRGETDEERLRDLQKRVPAVYAKLQASFQRAGINPFRAKKVLGQALEQRGWKPEARAAVIGSVLTKRTGPDRVQEVIRGAENLAGGGKVDVGHVGGVMELRGQGADTGASVKQSIDRIAAAAERDLAALSKMLADARSSGNDAKAEALADVLASSSVQKLVMLAQAFPGVRDRAIEPARDLLLGAPAAAPAAKPKSHGAEAALFVAEGGRPKALRARYRLMEASDVKASHDPTRGFQKRGDYPEGVQERAYHRDKAEQAKVTVNAQKLEPAFVINTNPDAVNGPPMITADGIALGGNSRTMSMQKAYADHPEKAAALRDYLENHAHEFGFSGEDVSQFKNPILVREVVPEDEGRKHTADEMRQLVRQMNESFTQGMDPRTMQVALGRKIDDRTLETLANQMEEGETLSAFLGSKRSEDFLNALRRVGLIDARNEAQYMTTKGSRKTLNEDGKTLVERVLVGRLVGDADVLSNTKPKIVSNLARSIPYLAQAKSAGAGYDLSGDMVAAIESLNLIHAQQDAKALPVTLSSKMKPEAFDQLFAQQTILGSGVDLPAAKNPRAKMLLEVLIRKPGPVQMGDVFKAYAKAALESPEGQGGFFGEADPEGTLRRIVEAKLRPKKAEPKKVEPEEEEPPQDSETASLF